MVLEGLRNVIRNNLGECQINNLGKVLLKMFKFISYVIIICVYVLNLDNFFLKMLKILFIWYG